MKAIQTVFRLVVTVALPLGSAAAFAAADFEDGLRLYYPFESSGDELVDVSGNENGGLLKGGAHQGAVRSNDGKYGKCIEFPTHLDGAAVLTTENMLVSQDDEGFTVSFWNFTTAWNFGGNRENRAVYKHNQYNVEFLGGGGRFHIYIGGAWKGVNGAPEIPTEAWHLTTAVWSPDDGAILYRDGILLKANAGAIGDIEENVEWMALGSFGLEVYQGKMDDLRIYDRPLDEDEVSELFEFDPGAQAVSPRGKLTTMWGTVKYYR